MGGGGQLQQQSEERSDEYRESNFEVVLQDNGMFCAKLRVAAAFYPLLIGKKGATKKRLENETRAKVTIPRQVNTTNKLPYFFLKSGGWGSKWISALSRITPKLKKMVVKFCCSRYRCVVISGC